MDPHQPQINAPPRLPETAMRSPPNIRDLEDLSPPPAYDEIFHTNPTAVAGGGPPAGPADAALLPPSSWPADRRGPDPRSKTTTTMMMMGTGGPAGHQHYSSQTQTEVAPVEPEGTKSNSGCKCVLLPVVFVLCFIGVLAAIVSSANRRNS